MSDILRLLSKSTKCYSGRLSGSAALIEEFIKDPESLTLQLETESCFPTTGYGLENNLCYSSAITAPGEDATMLQMGCWYTTDSDTVRYSGSQCLKEAGRVVCLCSGSLCNSGVPSASTRNPEASLTQVALGVLILLIALSAIAGLICFTVRQCKKSSRKRKVSGLGENTESPDILVDEKGDTICKDESSDKYAGRETRVPLGRLASTRGGQPSSNNNNYVASGKMSSNTWLLGNVYTPSQPLASKLTWPGSPDRVLCTYETEKGVTIVNTA